MAVVVAHLSSLPLGLLVVLGMAAFAELALDVVALVDLYRRPADQVVFENKWIWVAVVVLVNLLGAVLYLAIGRKPRPVADGETAVRRRPDGIQSAVDALYEKEDGSTRS